MRDDKICFSSRPMAITRITSYILLSLFQRMGGGEEGNIRYTGDNQQHLCQLGPVFTPLVTDREFALFSL